MSGFATKGALNLNNTNAGEPLWKDFDGVKDLAFDDITFQDGRKDGKEGETNGAQNNETPQGLNPNIIENYCQVTNNEFSAAPAKTSGVTEKPQLLFGGTEDPNADNGFFYVIPRNEDGGKVDVTIAYDVETIDPALAGKLSDNETHGISIENVISKLDIFGGLDFKAGYQYEINIHLGMTSVKVEATVTDWKDNGKTDVELPDNQEPYMDYYWKIGDAIYTSDPTEVSLSADKIFIVDDEASFNAAYAGPLGQYYNYYHAQNNAWYDPDPVTGLPSWTGLSTVEHNPAAGFGLPWVVIDLTQTPTFKGTLSVKYDGQDVLTDWAGRTSNDGSQNYVIIDATDFTTASAPATGVLTWNANASVWEKPANYAKWDVSKIEVILKRNDVKKYSYTTGQEVNP
jgi:hypothetical protein